MLHHERKCVSTSGVMRVFIEADDADSAREVASNLCSRLAAPLSSEIRSVEKYWKIPAWFEVVIGFSDAASIEDALARVQQLATNWDVRIRETDGSAMWSPEIGGTFSHPQVRWVNVECFRRS